jgi:hypothetical protein
VNALAHELRLGEHEHHGDDYLADGFMGGWWHTFVVGASYEWGQNHLFADFSVVMKGFRLPDDWVGGPAVANTLGTTWNL